MKSVVATSLLFLITSYVFAQNAPQVGKGVSEIELTVLLATGSTSERIARCVQDRGLKFTPDEAFMKSLRGDGADSSLLSALKSAPVRSSGLSAQNPSSSTKDTEALDHLHRAAQLNRNNFHPREAEPEFRAAVAADPENPFVHVALGETLAKLAKDDEAISEFRTALNLQPDLAEAHLNLGSALLHDRTHQVEASQQLQQAVMLAPSDPAAHYALANALDASGDKQGAAGQRKIGEGLGGYRIPMRIRVGGTVMQAKLISKTQPRYPKEAKAAHIEGTVRMNVMVGTDGAVKDIEVVSGHPALAQIAVDAVQKWRYQPTRLNGQAVEVITEVDINYILK